MSEFKQFLAYAHSELDAFDLLQQSGKNIDGIVLEIKASFYIDLLKCFTEMAEPIIAPVLTDDLRVGSTVFKKGVKLSLAQASILNMQEHYGEVIIGLKKQIEELKEKSNGCTSDS